MNHSRKMYWLFSAGLKKYWWLEQSPRVFSFTVKMMYMKMYFAYSVSQVVVAVEVKLRQQDQSLKAFTNHLKMYIHADFLGPNNILIYFEYFPGFCVKSTQLTSLYMKPQNSVPDFLGMCFPSEYKYIKRNVSLCKKNKKCYSFPPSSN